MLNTAYFSAESVKIMGETIGINSQTLADDAARKLGEDVTDKVKILICDALKFMEHSKRTCLTMDDIERAVKLNKLEPLYGFQNAIAEQFRFAAGGGRELYFIEEKEVNLDDVINGTRPKKPLEVRLHTNWLDVDSQQPSVQGSPGSAATVKVAQVACNPLIKLDLNVLTLSDKKENAIESVGNTTSAKAGVYAYKGIGKSSKKLRTTQILQVKQLAKHELSVEKQKYFKQICEALVSANTHRRIQALNSLSTDPGLFEMCSRICDFIADGVKINVAQQNLGTLINLMSAANALINNPSIYIEEHLHALVPAIITCVVSRQVSECPQVNAHWSLRTNAANLVARICKSYSNDINNMQTRVTRIYIEGLENPKMFLTTMYGALVGLCSLGTDVVKTFIIPRLKSISQRIENKIFNGSPDAMDKLTADRIRTLMSTHCSPILAEMRNAPDFVDDYRNDYGTCFATALCFGVLQARGTNSTTNTAAAPAPVIPTMPPLTMVTLSNDLTNTLSMPTQVATAAVAMPNRLPSAGLNRATATISNRLPVTIRFQNSTLPRVPNVINASIPLSISKPAAFPKSLSSITTKLAASTLSKRCTPNFLTQSQSLTHAMSRLKTVDEEIIIIDDDFNGQM